MIRVRNLHKSYGRLKVLNQVNLEFDSATSIAIIGPNGSGKTTLIKSIVGLVIPDNGDITVNDVSVRGDWRYRNQLSYLPQVAYFPPNLRVREIIRLVQGLRAGSSRVEELIDLFHMAPHLRKRIHGLSGGSKQKLNLILSLMYSSPVLILDEPSTGLDPLTLVRFKEFISNEKKQGRTILFTTHIMSLVEEMADRIVFLLDGGAQYDGTKDDLLKSLNETSVERAIARLLVPQEELSDA